MGIFIRDRCPRGDISTPNTQNRMDILKLSGLGLILLNIAKQNGKGISDLVAPALKAIAPKLIEMGFPRSLQKTDGSEWKKIALSAFALWFIWKHSSSEKILTSGKSTKQISVSSLDDRIQIISKMIKAGKANPKIRELVSKILHDKSVEEKDWDAEVEAVFEWVRENVRYTRDTEGLDTYTEPLKTVELAIGDCDDLSILIGSMLGAIGYPFKLKVVSMTGAGWDHVYPLVGMPPFAPTKWIPLDASIELPLGSEVVSKEHRIFEV